MDKSKYFHRTIIYTKRDNNVVLMDAHDATASPPLDPWLGKIYLLADGQHTLQELIELTEKHSEDISPDSVVRTLESIIGRLLDAKIIKLSETPVKLPYYLSISADDQDPKLATKLMLEDGYMQENKSKEEPVKH